MKLNFRKIREADLEMIMNWRMKPEITKFMNTDPKLTLEGQKKWLKHITKDESVRNWVIEVDDIPVGVLNLMDIDWQNKRCSWGYYVAEKSMRSLKLAMAIEWNLYDYVFEKMGLNKLTNEVLAFNKEVVTIHKMCGSDVVGILKQHIYKNGSYIDVVYIEICKDKWEVLKTKHQYPRASFEGEQNNED